MEKLKRMKFIDSFHLKLLAVIFMFCDHLWATLIPGNRWLTDIGRLAFPIFAFTLAEGFTKTKNFKKYFIRLLIFAIISEIPFNLMTGGSIFYPFQQNVMFTFAISLLFLNYMEKGKEKSKKSFIIRSIVSLIFGFLLGTITMVDYLGFGVLTVFLFYWFKDIKFGFIFELIGMILINLYGIMGQEIEISLLNHSFFFALQSFAVLSLIPIWLYNGKPGKKTNFRKYFFYIFYPLHMSILAVLTLYIIK